MTKFEKYMSDIKTGATTQSPPPTTSTPAATATAALANLDSSPISPERWETSASNPASPLKSKKPLHGGEEEVRRDGNGDSAVDNARMRECENARMRECENARM
jgi:hypothetical protein